VFKEFVGLLNLHINAHLALHAQTYGNLINIGVGTKEMNIELDLLKCYTTLFAIRHLINGGIDIRSSSPSQGFIEISQNLEKLFTDWFIANNSPVFQENEELNNDEGKFLTIRL
ncbi:6168_t:CDS:2, partial [Scutellospora calospora]